MSENNGSAPVETPVDTSTDNSNQNNTPVETQAIETKKYKVKDEDGTEIEVDEETLLRDYQIRKASDKKFREAAMMRKQAEDFIHLLKTDPRKVLSNPSLGLDLRRFAEEYLVEQLEEEMLDPKEKEFRKYKKMVEDQQAKEKAEKDKQDQERAEALRAKYTEDYSKQIVEALNTSGLPKSEHTVKRMAYYMHEGLKNGIDLKAKDIVDLVRQDYLNEQKSLIGGLDADALIQILGEETANKIRKWDVSRVKAQTKTAVTPQNQAPSVHVKEKKKITKDEWRAKLDKIKKFGIKSF